MQNVNILHFFKIIFVQFKKKAVPLHREIKKLAKSILHTHE